MTSVVRLLPRAHRDCDAAGPPGVDRGGVGLPLMVYFTRAWPVTSSGTFPRGGDGHQ